MRKINIRKIKLTKEEKEIEAAIGRGEHVRASEDVERQIREALEARKKNAVLNIRINQLDLECIKRKAKKLGVKYQTFISEYLHRMAS